MKYVWIFAAVVILVRIDVVLKFFDKQVANYSAPSTEIKDTEVAPSSTDLVSVDADLSLKSSPRKTFITMLEDFHTAPDDNIKLKGIEFLRSHPTMFTEKLDRDFESAIYRWRDLLLQRNKETQSFLLEMMKSLKGENLEMIKKFYSFSIDADMLDFLATYSKSTDTNCMIMSYLGDPLPDEEKYNELSERLTMLDSLLAGDKLAADIKAYASRCQIVLKISVDKLKAVVIPYEDPANMQPAPEEAPATVDPQAPMPSTPGTTP